jgi:transposase
MQTVSIGIDIAKDKFDVAFLERDRTSSVQTFRNTKEGISQFINILSEQGTAETVPCVVESTGLYHLPVALMVTNAGYRVNCINPLLTKKYQRSSVRNAKTDHIDATRLATIGLQETNLAIFKADSRAIEAKKIVNYVSRLELFQQQLKASTEAVRELETITGAKVDLSHVESAVKLIQKQINSLTKEIVERTPEAILKIGDGMRGITKERISLLFALIGDKDFASRDSLVAFLGMDVTPRESGTWRGKGKLSKRGNGYGRKLLYQMAWGLKQHNSLYAERYAELRASGKDYRTTLLILGRKFLRLIYSYHFKQTI